MDQFCAKQNDTYRRCVCSSRINDIKSRERVLSQTSDQLLDFKNLNIDVIPKTSGEVKAMLNATAGELAASTTKDTSDSAQKLAGISDVLSGAKSKALSTSGTLDIAGDINAIWATTDLTSGVNIANLTGEKLYNAVHSQCVEMVADKCVSTATLNMVVSAYGMYIENDCTALSTALDKKLTAAGAAIRSTESEMHSARLDNYDAHNSTSINDCIAQVRKDITADTACGTNYIHCLDISGKYLNYTTGEPIYTPDFYQLETSISLSGDVLTNQTNRMLVAELNKKRTYAERGLETCRDLADEVWDEFMRQAIAEIYQGQHARIRQVKEECLDVVNTCYDEQSQSLKDFSNVKEQMLLGARLELSEEMCREKLQACSNLYGGGKGGMQELVKAMHAVTDQKIALQCQTSLRDYAKEMCSVASNDSLHAYPYGCRTYAPGSQIYATNNECNKQLQKDPSQTGGPDDPGTEPDPTIPPQPDPTGDDPLSVGFTCNPIFIDDVDYPTVKYIACQKGFYMVSPTSGTECDPNPVRGNNCLVCQEGKECLGGTSCPTVKVDPNPGGDEEENGDNECGDYPGSLYQKLVRYAQQACVRPSQSESALPSNVLQDVNVVMDSIRVDMAKALATECERQGGVWVDTIWGADTGGGTTRAGAAPTSTTDADIIFDKQSHKKLKKFYDETNSSTGWGYCADVSKPESGAPEE